MTILKPQPLTKAAFAAYGDVIETADRDYFLINNDSTQRYHKLASVQLSAASDQAIISIFLTLLFWIPGVIHALFVVHSHLADVRTDKIVDAIKDQE